MGEDGADDRYEVVVNDEEQYSILPAASAVPAGWRPVGVRGSREHCLAHVERVWTDLRPASLRRIAGRPGRRGQVGQD